MCVCIALKYTVKDSKRVICLRRIKNRKWWTQNKEKKRRGRRQGLRNVSLRVAHSMTERKKYTREKGKHSQLKKRENMRDQKERLSIRDRESERKKKEESDREREREREERGERERERESVL